MSGPFRETVRELSQAAFDEIKALGENLVAGIVAEANRQVPPLPPGHHRPSQTTQLQSGLDGSIGRYLCQAFRWKSVTAWRHEAHGALVIVAKLACGYKHHMSIDEAAIEDTHPSALLDLIHKTWERSRKAFQCYCVPRFGTEQV